jgi:hypothetical protein
MNKIIGLSTITVALIVATSVPHFSFAESSFTINTQQIVYDPSSRIFVYGQVNEDIKFYVPLMLTMYDYQNQIIYNIPITPEDGQYHTLLTGPQGAFEPGLYTLEISHESIPQTATVMISITDTD